MLLKIDFLSEEPIYMQIRNQIVVGIASGNLRDGDALPSVRTLGEEIGVNLHTVNKAYKLLQKEGFITLARSRGAVVHAGNAARNAADFLQTAEGTMRNIVSEAVTRHVDRVWLHHLVNALYDEFDGPK
ncbi:MAG: GntR family transcriptional regulator [Ethanoligenens sp.]